MDEPVDTYAATLPTDSQTDTLPGLPIEQAAQSLGVSSSTVRRWVREGRLRSEKIARPQGYIVRVHLPGQLPKQTPEQPREQLSDQQTPAWTPDHLRAEAMAAYNRSLLEPLVTRMTEQEGIIRELEREVGRLTAENSALKASQTQQETNPEPRPDPFPAPLPPSPNGARWWRRTLAWLYG